MTSAGRLQVGERAPDVVVGTDPMPGRSSFFVSALQNAGTIELFSAAIRLGSAGGRPVQVFGGSLQEMTGAATAELHWTVALETNQSSPQAVLRVVAGAGTLATVDVAARLSSGAAWNFCKLRRAVPPEGSPWCVCRRGTQPCSAA